MDIKKLDLEYQYTMLAHHVKTFLDEVSNFDTYDNGLYQVIDDDLEPMIKRLEVINSLHKMSETEVCEDFAQEGCIGFGEREVYNYWPSSQLCMECEHGVFIIDEPASTYTCEKGVQLGPCASSCSMFEEKEEYLDE
jgi:hypothetical protein